MRKAIGRLLCTVVVIGALFGLLGGGSATAVVCNSIGGVGVCYEIDANGADASAKAGLAYLQVIGHPRMIDAGVEVGGTHAGAALYCSTGKYVLVVVAVSQTTPIACL